MIYVWLVLVNLLKLICLFVILILVVLLIMIGDLLLSLRVIGINFFVVVL